jgi:predicted acylesterase/phospholipase RssA
MLSSSPNPVDRRAQASVSIVSVVLGPGAAPSTQLIFVTGQPYVLSLSAHSLLRYSKSLAQLKVDFSRYSVHDNWIPFRPATADITNNRHKFWTQGGLLQCVIASMWIPGILAPLRMEDGSIHVDGSVMDNLPIEEARRCTSGVVIAISLDHRYDHVFDVALEAICECAAKPA